MRKSTHRIALSGLLSLLAACAHKPEVETVIRHDPVIVAVGCVTARPQPPVPLLSRFTDKEWEALAPGAMAWAAKAQAGRRMNYADHLAGSTAGCKDAPITP